MKGCGTQATHVRGHRRKSRPFIPEESFEDATDIKQSSTYHNNDNQHKPELVTVFGTKCPLEIAPARSVPELQPFRKALHDAWTRKGLPVTEDIYTGK